MHVFPVGKGRGKTCSSLSKSCKGNSVCIVLPSFLVVCNKLVLCCLKFLSEIISKDRVKCHFYPVTRLYISCPGEPAAASVLWKNDWYMYQCEMSWPYQLKPWKSSDKTCFSIMTLHLWQFPLAEPSFFPRDEHTQCFCEVLITMLNNCFFSLPNFCCFLIQFY